MLRVQWRRKIDWWCMRETWKLYQNIPEQVRWRGPSAGVEDWIFWAWNLVHKGRRVAEEGEQCWVVLRLEKRKGGWSRAYRRSWDPPLPANDGVEGKFHVEHQDVWKALLISRTRAVLGTGLFPTRHLCWGTHFLLHLWEHSAVEPQIFPL